MNLINDKPGVFEQISRSIAMVVGQTPHPFVDQIITMSPSCQAQEVDPHIDVVLHTRRFSFRFIRDLGETSF
jgi:hypothetical protein